MCCANGIDHCVYHGFTIRKYGPAIILTLVRRIGRMHLPEIRSNKDKELESNRYEIGNKKKDKAGSRTTQDSYLATRRGQTNISQNFRLERGLVSDRSIGEKLSVEVFANAAGCRTIR